MSNIVNTTLVSYIKAKKKANIPKALREQVWITNVGNKFETKCLVVWCQNKINVFDYHVGHNIPESHGGATNINNLKPICARCNLSMGNYYSIEEWSKMGQSIQQNIPQSINKNSVKWPSATPTTAPTTTTIPAKKPWLICC